MSSQKRPALFSGLVAMLVVLMYPISFGVMTALILFDVLPDSCEFAYRTIYAPILWLLTRGRGFELPLPDE